MWICHQVGHARQCAIWKNALICDKMYTRGIFDQKGLDICCFESLTTFIRQIKRKMKSECPERREKRGLEIPGAMGEPATLYIDAMVKSRENMSLRCIFVRSREPTWRTRARTSSSSWRPSSACRVTQEKHVGSCESD